jgi:hypothetical protein
LVTKGTGPTDVVVALPFPDLSFHVVTFPEVKTIEEVDVSAASNHS